MVDGSVYAVDRWNEAVQLVTESEYRKVEGQRGYERRCDLLL